MKKLFFTLVSLVIVSNIARASWNNVPVLIRISDAVKPSKVFTINGEGLDSGLVTIAMAQDLTGASPLTPTSGWTSAGIVQYDNKGNFVVVRFPSSLPAGIYNVWVQNSFGWSKPIKLNAPRAQFISEKEAWPGLEIELVGRNFDGIEYGALTNTQIRLNNGTNTYSQTIVSLNPYNVKFKITASTPTGSYNVNVSNDGGINWSKPSSEQILSILPIGRDDYNLGVAWANDFNYDTIYNVVNNGVPVNSGTNVTAQVQAVIDLVKSKGGGVVYFPNGTYKISSVSLPSKVILAGQNMYLTQIQHSITPNQGVLIKAKNDGITNGVLGLYNLSLGLANTTDSVKCDFFWPNGGANCEKIFVKKVNINYQPTIAKSKIGNGRGIIVMANQRVLVANSRIVGWNANNYFFVKNYVTFKDNVVDNSNGIMVGSYAAYTFYENDSLNGHVPNNVSQHSGLSAHDFSYFGNNYVANIGGAGNDGEGLLVECPDGPVNYGSVTGGSNMSINAVAQSTTNPLAVPTTTYYGTLSVQIIDGRGLGQLRKVTSITGNTILVDKPWDVVPDNSSKWQLFFPNQNVTWYKNKINNCGAGYIMYGEWADGVVAENQATNSIGISLTSVARNGNFVSGYFNRIVSNTITGVSWYVKYGAISINPARFNSLFNGVYAGVQMYGNEIRGNTVSGDASQTPVVGYTAPNTKANIALCEFYGTNFYGGYYTGSFIARDLLNTIIDGNGLNNSKYGIEISRGVYGVVECNNTIQNVTISTYSIEPAVIPVVEQNCGFITGAGNENLTDQENKLLVFPNPTNKNVTAKALGNSEAINSIIIYSASGQQLMAYDNLHCFEKIIQIDNLPEGIYFAKFIAINGKISLIKIIKN